MLTIDGRGDVTAIAVATAIGAAAVVPGLVENNLCGAYGGQLWWTHAGIEHRQWWTTSLRVTRLSDQYNFSRILLM